MCLRPPSATGIAAATAGGQDKFLAGKKQALKGSQPASLEGGTIAAAEFRRMRSIKIADVVTYFQIENRLATLQAGERGGGDRGREGKGREGRGNWREA